MDLSNLDKKYFIDQYVFNCPFCKRNNVKYTLQHQYSFDWSAEKKCYAYYVQCSSCENISIHFSYEYLLNQYSSRFEENIDIDSKLFFSQPTSYFILDDRIPSVIRRLVHEAEKSRQANLLVGASACIRKSIYELIRYEKVQVINGQKRTDYQKSIEELKKKFPKVAKELFDFLSNIQEMTSDSLHEESWEAWGSKNLLFLTELLKTVLDEMYVLPEEQKKRQSLLTQLKASMISDKQKKNNTHQI